MMGDYSKIIENIEVLSKRTIISNLTTKSNVFTSKAYDCNKIVPMKNYFLFIYVLAYCLTFNFMCVDILDSREAQKRKTTHTRFSLTPIGTPRFNDGILLIKVYDGKLI